ncbi:DUF523 domain-containing protein [Allofournierella sp.]|uniref:DUF523 domain-containing protein n=1 Tax=Allofournierella sp. TaxID=1940256 RepID=UPI003AB708E2
MRILISACLLGKNCRYNGTNSASPRVRAFVEGHETVEICPELLAGMPTPRPCAELAAGVVVDEQGRNVDEEYRRGARLALEQAKKMGIDLAVLQPRSPTCGVNQVYDGSFTGRLVKGRGVFAQALLDAGYTVLDAEELP